PLESDDETGDMTGQQRENYLAELEERMREAAKKFEFEKAAQIRDRLKALRSRGLYEEISVVSPDGRG
ncbi:MAG: UvrB/UvrC motif-containing protein, partial [Bryobacteraceae bacterium]